MVAERLGRFAAKVMNAVEPAAQKVKATEFAQRLRDEFERGRAGESDDTPSAPSADGSDSAGADDRPTARAGNTVEAVDVDRSATNAGAAQGSIGEDAGASTDSGSSATDPSASAPSSSDVDSVVDALRSVDWTKVRAATSERSSAAARKMREMAADVDWGRVQAGAAVVSSALIAAVASGQVPLGGRLAGPVAKAILNDADLAGRVSARLKGDSAPPDLRNDVRPN